MSPTARFATPLLLALLTILFVGFVIYQTGNEEDRISGLPTSPEDTGPGAYVEEPTKEVSSLANPASEQTPVEDSPEILRFRRDIAEYMEFLRWDRKKYEENGPKIAQMREQFRDYLASLPDSAVPLLLDLLHNELEDPNGDFVLRRFLIYGIAAVGSDAAVDGLTGYYLELYDLDEPKVHEINHTIKALGQVDTEYSFETLRGLAEKGSQRQDRFRFVEELGNHSLRADAVPLFTDFLETTTPGEWKIRARSATGLKKVAALQTAGKVEQAIARESNYVVKQSLMGALGAIGDPRSLPTLENVVFNDRDDFVNRLSAIDAIARIGGARAISILERVAAEDDHERVRADAQRALARLDR